MHLGHLFADALERVEPLPPDLVGDDLEVHPPSETMLPAVSAVAQDLVGARGGQHADEHLLQLGRGGGVDSFFE